MNKGRIPCYRKAKGQIWTEISYYMMERNWHKCSVEGHFDAKIDCLYEERLVDLPPPRQALKEE